MVCNHKVGKDGDNFIVRLSGSDGYLVTECDGITPTPSPSPSPSATPPPPTPTPTPSASSPPIITASGWYCHSGVECPEPWCGYYEIGSVGSYCNMSGPFATEAECFANCGIETPTPTNTPTTTPSTSSPPQYPNIAGWYCIKQTPGDTTTECTQEPTVVYYDGTGGPIISWCQVNGPYSTEAEAQAVCSGSTPTPTGTPGSTPTATP